MSLQLIIGRAGSGKSHHVLQQITTAVSTNPLGSPLILIAPEQATFQIERTILQTPDISGSLRTQVLGFHRLAYRIMQETGGAALIPISDEGKKMLLYKVMARHRDELDLYGRAADQLGFIEEINTLYTEFKRYKLDSQGLQRSLAVLEQGDHLTPLFRDKLHDLALIYREFEAECAGLYIDAEDHLAKLVEGTPFSTYIKEAEIWIDGFYSFTPQELDAIGALMKQAKKVTVCLTLDRPYDIESPQELDLFHGTGLACYKLMEMAKEHGIEVKPTIVLEPNTFPRFTQSQTLGQLEKLYASQSRRKRADVVNPPDLLQSLSLRAAANRRSEVEGVARHMVRLARDERARWRDMAIFVSNLEDYQHVFETMLEQFEIPYFIDKKFSMLSHPLVEFMRAALNVVLKNWKYEDVFRCVKTGCLFPTDDSLTWGDMDDLENYILASGISGYRWYDGTPWNLSSQASLEEGEPSTATQEAHATRLHKLELCRAAIVQPLYAFGKKLHTAKSVTEMCKAVYELLIQVEAPHRLDLWAHEALQQGQAQQALEHRQLWKKILDVLDQMVEMMGEEQLDALLFAGVLETGLKSLHLSLVPPSLDQVLIGTIDRTRSNHVKHVFLLGLNEGVLPAVKQDMTILNPIEREVLDKNGVVLGPNLSRQQLDERFLIYSALTSADTSLWLSYPKGDEEGKSLLPSEVIRQVKGYFAPYLTEVTLGGYTEQEDEEAVLSLLTHPQAELPQLIARLRMYQAGIPIARAWWEVLGWYKTQPNWRDQTASLLQSLGYKNKTATLQPITSKRLYGKVLRTSVSRMEKFSACPFSHFASYGLALRERKVFALKAPDIGQLFHAALSKIALTLQEQGKSWGLLSEEECWQQAEEVVDHLVPKLQGQILLSSKRYGYITRKLKNIVGRASVILGEQAKRASFEPVGLELDFGPGRPLPPLTFKLPNGYVMEIVGRIDRVDMAESEQGLLLRVIDYKSSQTDLKLHEVYYGLSLQMLTYLDVLLTSAEAWLGQRALPAGTLYFHVHNPLLQNSNHISQEQAKLDMLKAFKMKGLILADRDVIAKMDAPLDKGYSDILPVALKADGGFYSSASVATLEQWETLLSNARHTIETIGTRITEGDVEISPYRLGTETACTHCAYRSVCQFDDSMEGNDYHLLRSKNKNQMWELLEGIEKEVKPL